VLPNVIMVVSVGLHCGLSYRNAQKLLAERGIMVDHVTVSRWVQRFRPLLINAAQ
jgi:transposase, IS6 family